MKDFEPIHLKELEMESFGRKIYKGGILQINPDTYLEDLVSKFSLQNPERVRELYADRVPWIKQFNGKVPARWETHHYIIDDMKEAHELVIQLGESLVTAAVSHPLWHVPFYVADYQKFNSHQLRIAYKNVSSSKWQDIVEGQRAQGVSEDTIFEALRYVRRLQRW